MKKGIFAKLPFLLSLLLAAQLVFPVMSAFAAEGSSTMLPPSNLASQLVTPDDVKLTWSSVYGATGYNVYGITDGQIILLGSTAAASYSINNLPEGSYTYVVSTLGPDGESGPCAPITVDIVYPDMTAPATLTYTLQNGNDIVLNWSASPYSESYKVYRIEAGGQPTLVASVTGRTYTVVNAPEGTSSYAVTAGNSLYGESPLSPTVEVSVAYPAMAAPVNFTFTVANGSDVTLKWNAVTYATGYKVYQLVDGEKVLKSTVTGKTTVTYTNHPAGDYVYEVHSYSDRFGESIEGSQLNLTVSSIVMAAPANFAYKLQNVNDVVLTWTAASYATSYKIYQIIDGQPVLKSTVTGTSVTYTNQPGGDYTYEIRSYSDRYGESASGSQVSLTVGTVTMAAPADFAYKLQNGNDIVLTWTAAANTNSYKVYQIVNGQKTLKSTVTSTTVTFANQPAGEYSYEVTSYSTRFGESADASRLSFSLVLPTMEPPQNLTQTVKNATDFSLSWSASAYATSYKVYQIVNGQKVLKNTVSGTTISYTKMTPGEYTYVVHSVSSRFGESLEGAQLTFTLDGQVMAAPTNPTYTITNGNDITLKWTAVSYATSYKIYQVVDGQEVLKSTVTGTTAIYTNQPAGDYDFVIRSYSTLLGESPEGAEVTFQLVYPIMAAPANFKYSIQNGNDVVLTWASVPYANSYKVYELVDGQEVLKKSVTTLSTTLSREPAGDHIYVVRSVSTRFGESPEAGQVQFTLEYPVMQKPGNLTNTIANGNDITLKWNAVTYATAYNVYQVVDGAPVLKKTVTGTSAAFANMPFGNYSYEVRSFSDRFGESAEAAELSFVLSDYTMQAPLNFTKTITNGNDITLKWNASTYATAYKVYQIVDGEKILKRTVTSTSTVFTNMPEGDYVYQVYSYSSRFFESPEGSQVEFTLVWPTMQAPADPASSITNGNDITLRWTAAAYATAYKVYQVVDGQKKLLKTVTTKSTSFINMPEGDYHYEIHSYSDRFGESPAPAVVELTLIWPVVQPPVLKGTVFNANNITFTWQAVTWANEYRVYEIIGDARQLVYKGTALTAKVYNLSEETHRYEMTAYNTRFGESAASDLYSETIVYPIMQPPTASLTLLSDTSARISWTFATYANGYNIYEIIDDKRVLIAANVNNLSYTVNDLTYADHEYVVTSYSNSFGESEASNIVLAKLIIDTKPPVTTADAATGWTNQNQVVTLTATDDVTGVKNTYYAVNDNDYAEGTSITVEEEGITKISFYSVDKVGNIEQAHTIYVKIDRTAPVTEASEVSEWSQSAQLKLTATDGQSGVAKTYYSINGADYAEGNSFTVDQEGVNRVSFYSVDAAGNRETTQTVEVKIDGTAPVTSSNAPEGWMKEDVTVSLTATDEQSGVAKVYYSVDGADYVQGTSFTVRGEGVHTVSFYAVDAAGNIETAHTASVKIDKSAPIISMKVTGEQKLGTTVQLTYEAIDNLSGIVSDQMTVTGPDSSVETVVANGGSLTLAKPGVYNITVTATNGAGLTTTISEQILVYIPATIEVTPKVIKGNNGVFTVRVDLPAGFSTQGFDLDTATLNGVKALSSNNGYYSQAKNGQFKFERSDFSWTGSEAKLVFRGYVDGQLVVGETTVKLQK